MKRIFCCACVILFFATLSAAAQDIPKIKITDLERTIRESKTPLVINFWATFCIPCLKEMPAFEAIAATYGSQGLRVLFVSLDMQDDYPVKIRATINKNRIKSPVTWLDETNADYFCPRVDSAWGGELPATLFVNGKTGYRKFTGHPLSAEQLQQEIGYLLKPATQK